MIRRDENSINIFHDKKNEAGYIYSFSTRRRVYKWSDLKVSVWI